MKPIKIPDAVRHIYDDYLDRVPEGAVVKTPEIRAAIADQFPAPYRFSRAEARQAMRNRGWTEAPAGPGRCLAFTKPKNR